ncbi:MAG TPA: biosynthetic-type acetolactate synthase large subunit [Candidatus Hydrogenedens sp.]|nr:biosynthetic-type acetolactate synthase large subunit [Candidatus Hydrogenedens sp.]
MITTKKHELAGAKMKGADMVLQVLADEGVKTIFGYSGGAILPAYDAIFRWNRTHKEHPIRLIVPANEQGAGFMASGYARATGDVGVFMVTSGPGATNATTPIRDAMADSIPLVMISGQVARPAVGTDAFQEAPVFNLMSSCAKHVFLVKEPEKLEEIIRTAFYIARTGRPGPVVIDLPKDVQSYDGIFKGKGLLPLHGYQSRMQKIKDNEITPDEAKEFFTLLRASKKPLLYVGGGVIASNASTVLQEFARHFHIPVVTTLMGIGVMDTHDPLYLHMLGMHGTPYANYAVMDCDFLIAVGARFDDRVAGLASEFAENAKIAHVDIDPAEIGKVKSVVWAHVGDAGKALKTLLQYGKNITFRHDAWIKHIQKLKQEYPLNYDRNAQKIQPPEVIEALNDIVKGEAIFTTGVGQHQMFVAQYLHVKYPRTFITSGSMGTMGFGLPAAIGAQLARPDKIVIDIDGDGSIRMNFGEMETCTNYDIPVKILLLNNHGDGMVYQWQELYFEGRFSGSDKSLHKKDFVKSAEADGYKFAKRVTNREDLRKTLEEFIKFDKGPAFLEVVVDKKALVFPMVGPGLGYKDMMTGPFIKSREVPKVEEEHISPSDAFAESF